MVPPSQANVAKLLIDEGCTPVLNCGVTGPKFTNFYPQTDTYAHRNTPHFPRGRITSMIHSITPPPDIYDEVICFRETVGLRLREGSRHTTAEWMMADIVSPSRAALSSRDISRMRNTCSPHIHVATSICQVNGIHKSVVCGPDLESLTSSYASLFIVISVNTASLLQRTRLGNISRHQTHRNSAAVTQS